MIKKEDIYHYKIRQISIYKIIHNNFNSSNSSFCVRVRSKSFNHLDENFTRNSYHKLKSNKFTT